MPRPLRTRPSAPGRTRRGPPRVVVAAAVAFAGLLACWSVVAPLLEAPDEPDHLALVLYLADGRPYPEYDALQSPQGVYDMCYQYVSSIRACPRPGEVVTPTAIRTHPRDEAPDRADRETIDDPGVDVPVGAANQMPQHPPLYYQVMASVLRVERAVGGGPWSLDRELALLRLANVALLAPLPLLGWWAARRFGLDDGAATVAALLPFGLPMLTHIGSTLNNDNLLNLLGSVVLALLAGVVRGDRRLGTAVALGLATGLGMLTKAFAIVFPPVIVLAYVVGARATWEAPAPAAPEPVDPGPPESETTVPETERVPEPVPEPARVEPRGWGTTVLDAARPLGVAGVLAAATSLWWFVGLRLRTGTFTPTVEDQALTEASQPEGFVARLGPFAREWFRLMDNRFWGSFGWYSVRFSTFFALACTVVLVGLVVVGLARRRAALAGSILLVPLLALGVVVFVRAWDLHQITGQWVFIQGRYLFAGILGPILLAAAGLRRLARRWAVPVAAVAVAALQAHSLWRSVDVWWGGPGVGPRGRLQALGAYSGWPEPFVAVLGAAAVVALGWLVWCLARPLFDRPVGSAAP